MGSTSVWVLSVAGFHLRHGKENAFYEDTPHGDVEHLVDLLRSLYPIGLCVGTIIP